MRALPPKGQKNDTLYQPIEREPKEMNKTVRSKIEAAKKYNANLEQIAFRVPKGYKDVIKAYAENKGTSVNQLIIDLLEKEMGMDLSKPLNDEGKSDIIAWLVVSWLHTSLHDIGKSFVVVRLPFFVLANLA